MTVTILVRGLAKYAEYLKALPEITRKAAKIAVNDTARDARKKIVPERMETEVAFPPGYLQDDRRLAVATFATDDSLTAVVAARPRATSLARFVTAGRLGQRGGGITVKVNPGHSIPLKRAFLIRLKRGASLTEDQYNLGLAVRLPAGTVVRHKNVHVQESRGGLHILYAPSVDQVFKTVAADVSDELGDVLEFEFVRQMARLA